MITSPKLIFKISNIKPLQLTVLHGLLFICTIYLTQHFIVRYREGVNDNTSLETDSPAASNKITIHNKILDYTNYTTNNSEDNDPLPGPIPK